MGTCLQTPHGRLAVFLLLICCLLGACQPRNLTTARQTEKEQSLLRASPGYVQWLERQSFLTRGQEDSALVSASLRAWTPPPPRRLELLLHAAPTWLQIHTPTYRIHRSVAADLSSGEVLNCLHALGITGMYLSPLQEGNAVWGPQTASDAVPDDIPAAPAPDRRCGTEEDLYRLSSATEQAGLQMGSNLLSAATGTGPDFQLALRHVRDYPGSYALLDLSSAPAALLPPASAEAVPLSPDRIRALQDARLLPPLERDRLPGAAPGGWAISSAVAGIDGNQRRHAYRYVHSPQHPVLHWEDPSGAARRMVTASAIRSVGLLRHSLAGFHAEALWGLGPAATDVPAQGEPLFSALRELARQTQRYGGWLVQMDPLPASLTAAVLATGTDFTWDSLTTPAAEYALLTGDTTPLRQLLEAALRAGVDQRRLLRAMPGPDGISFRPLLNLPEGEYLRQKLLEALQAHNIASCFQEDTLYLSAPALAAALCHLSIEKTPSPDEAEALSRVHLLLTAFRASLPGLFMLQGQDLAGVLAPAVPLPPLRARGAWGLTAGGNEGDAPPAATAYPAPVPQKGQDSIYFQQLRNILALRSRYALAEARLMAVLPTWNNACLALLLQTPDGGQFLTVSNFSQTSSSGQLSLPAKITSARDILHEASSLALHGTALSLSLSPWEHRLIQLNRQACP